MDSNKDIIKKAVVSTLEVIDSEREREIISRRFGLNGSKETLEEIGEMLGITRERVRQLEKAILIRLRLNAEDGKITELPNAEKLIKRNLAEMGRAARVADLSEKIFETKPSKADQAKINFLSTISSELTNLDESDKYYGSVTIKTDYPTEKDLTTKVDEVVTTLKNNKKSMTIEELDQILDYEHPNNIKAVASVSKSIAHLGNLYGLTKWADVNPKNIRDKIYIVLQNHKEPLHFSKIAENIKNSEFRRKNVTIQAIHNELIKDKRFVLVGRGIYALEEWGYSAGTVSDMIIKILSEAKQPMHRDEIVRQVLKMRKVKETTILLNLQDRKLIDRIDKNTYSIKK